MTRIIFLLLCLIMAGTGPTTASDWAIIKEASHLRFQATQGGQTFEGEFRDFDADIHFDPQNLETAKVGAVIDMTSATAGDDDRDAALPSSTWFDTKSFKQAFFQSTDFQKTGADQYLASGTLEIKGVSRPVRLPFTLTIEDNLAHMTGELKIVRTNFDVGTGDFESGRWIGLDVTVLVSITAERPKAERITP